ncbi:MAG: thioester reductase domain-containing protein [Candidatus Latescibacteria bacterium]|nr:thioester reductase domain-containing protein [Candidatus Latescibacterota bacterium]
MGSPATIVEVLETRGTASPAELLFTWLADGEGEELRLTCGELFHRARALAACLQQRARPGTRVLLLFAPGLEYLTAFCACLCAGMTAVPVYPVRQARHLPRLRATAADCGAGLVLTTAEGRALLAPLLAEAPELPGLEWVCADEVDPGLAAHWQRPAAKAGDLAFLQYTSGSTAAPRGVELTHGNLLYNLELIHQRFGTGPGSQAVCWLPPYHDMGLIGGLLQPLYAGAHSALISPVSFLQQPLRWLQAISRFGATINGGPNFAYELCARRATPEALAQLDLSCWEVAFVGAEPVRAATLEHFAATFAPCGFRRRAFYPCYGLAEATLLVTGGQRGQGPVCLQVDRQQLRQHRVVPLPAGHPDGQTLVGCGRPAPDQALAIVDPQTCRRCPPGEVGEIWLTGPGVARGYWNRLAETAQTFGARLADEGTGPYLRTGDLGFVQEGELFVAGRLKDLIILRGRNHHPQDLEASVSRSHPALVGDGAAAFAVEQDGGEELVVAQEVERRQLKDLDTAQVAGAIRRALWTEHELAAHTVVLLRPGTLPRTSSGKVQRHACRTAFLEGALAALATHRAAGTDKDNTELRDQIARLLGLAPAQLLPDQPLHSQGLDSLRAVEIREYLETTFGLAVPLEDFAGDLDLEELSARLDRQRHGQPIERPQPSSPGQPLPPAAGPLHFSLFYFSAEAGADPDKYRLLREGARFADENGFEAVWIPERHFHPFGGLYPNPAVLAGALALQTRRLRLRAGSVVMPLHHPVRVAEEWAMVDNLSGGRVDLGFARGWNPDDFALAPQHYAERTQVLYQGIEQVRRLWQGEALSLVNGQGNPVEVRIHPRPLQPELRVWITCTEDEVRFAEAGAAGANVLTALLFQTPGELAAKIARYRQARARAGHDPATGRVTLMLHTLIGADEEEVRRQVKEPFGEYLRTSMDLWRQGSQKLEELTASEREEVLAYAFERYWRTSALFGTPESCAPLVDQLVTGGVNEIACLIDFGVPFDQTMAGLQALARFKERWEAPGTVARHYDALVQHTRQAAAAGELYLTFGLFPQPLPGFSWLETCSRPAAHPEHAARARQAQQALRDALFGQVDFSRVTRALDIGCGHAADLVELGLKYPQLQLDGYTLSPGQARLGEQRLRDAGLADRVHVWQRDSSREPFPAEYELVFGFEVAVYVRDKAALLANIAAHLREGGLLLLADFAAAQEAPIDHPPTSSHIPPAAEWAAALADNHLCLERVDQVGEQVAHFLADPSFDERLETLGSELGELRLHFTAWHRLGLLLGSGRAHYFLATARLDRCRPRGEVLRRNLELLQTPEPATWHQIHLEAEIRPPAVPAARPPDRVLLTGATGFLGAHLLAELLRATPAQVCCLVRASGADAGLARVRAALGEYGLWQEDFAARLNILPGDLAQPRWGLDEAGFAKLAEGIDAIYHSAAQLNFVYPYEALRPANVEATRQVLRLACHAKAIPVHYISSTAVFDAPAYAGRAVDERTDPGQPEGMLVGYAQSKWAAEQLVLQAGQRGLPVSVYRPAWVFAHSRDGACKVDDFVCRLLRGCAAMGSAPALDYEWNLVPVDYASRAIVRLSLAAGPGTWHLINPQPVAWNWLVAELGRRGYPVQSVPYAQWQEALRRQGPGGALGPLRPLFLEALSGGEMVPQRYRRTSLPRLEDRWTRARLEGTDLACPVVGPAAVAACLDYLETRGALPPPEARR